MTNKDIKIELSNEEVVAKHKFDIDAVIYDLDQEIDLISSKADKIDYLVSVASGVLCAMIDILWVGEFDLASGKRIADKNVEKFVSKIAKFLGCKNDDIGSSVAFLEKYRLASDGNTPDFGGGLQHHLRDFSHHSTIVGLIFSLLTQFTGKAYGTDVNGKFLITEIKETHKQFIGKDIPTKIFYGTIKWFLHLVSDMAGSKGSAGKSGGTGIPGPILSLAKELSTLPVFKNVNIGDTSLSQFIEYVAPN